MKPEHQVCVIYAGVNGFLDKMETSKIPEFEKKFLEFMTGSHQGMFDEIRKSTELSKENGEKLASIMKDWLPQSGLV